MAGLPIATPDPTVVMVGSSGATAVIANTAREERARTLSLDSEPRRSERVASASNLTPAKRRDNSAATRAMSTGLSQRVRARTRSSLGMSRRRAGGGVFGEGAAVAAEARRRERRRGGADIARKRIPRAYVWAGR